MSTYVSLHNHTEYSLLDGLSKIKNLLKKVKEFEMPAVALTDHGTMYGAIEFYKECLVEKIKPLIGLEGYIVAEDHNKKDGKEDRQNNHILLLAKNYQGYQNLMRLTSIAHLEGFYYKPRFDHHDLEKYKDGLICLSACPKGEIGQELIADNFDKAKKLTTWYQELFGEGNFFLEIQRHQYSDFVDKAVNEKIAQKLRDLQISEDKWLKGIKKLSDDLGIPMVATNDSHYLTVDEAFAQDVLMCIGMGKTVTDTDRMRYVDVPTFHLRNEKEMKEIFPDCLEAIDNTVNIAEMCDVQIELGKWYFPNFKLPEGKTAVEVLKETVYLKLPNRFENPSKEVLKRLDYELDVICQKGYAPYFLMMAEMINWCNERGVFTNTRGSAAGSVVSYVLGITNVDPVRYGLPFERFLNPFRPKPPDIDLDIADDRRQDLLAHIVEKYGQDKVAQICTFGRMLSKAAVRDVGRVLGFPYSFPDKIAKIIPEGSQGFPMNMAKALETSPELKVMYDTDSEAKRLIDLAIMIEGNARHASVHAAGVVVSPEVMTNYTPLQHEPKGEKVITQFEMHACEDVGLVKFDILGIRNLSILGAAVDIIEKKIGTKINLDKIPFDDAKTFEMLADGGTMGTFQLGGAGMTKWLVELKPNRIEDLMVMVALFRPGPMANIPEFIARKNGKSPVTYLHSKMANFLEKSYGIMVYQEDILFTALELAGYTWESVDALRQAIGKKKPKEMAQQHEIFVSGCVKTSKMLPAEAEQIWDLFVPFQGYGFNKAHAASYGIVAYQTSYLKCHYPVEYMTALLTAETGDTDKIVEAVEECRRMKISVLPPDINKSDSSFTIEGKTIRFGLSAIKNVGVAAVSAILPARNQGSFRNIADFASRVDLQKVNKKVLESLIKSGAMDQFGKRAAQLAVLEKIIDRSHKAAKNNSAGQDGLFGTEEEAVFSDFSLPEIDEMPREELLEKEKELLGFYLTEHPKRKFLEQLGSLTDTEIAALDITSDVGKILKIGGLISSVRKVFTKKNNEEMCFVTLQGLTGTKLDCVVFPRLFKEIGREVCVENNVVVFIGKIDNREEKLSMIVDKALKVG